MAMQEQITPLAQSLLDCVVDRLIADGRPVCEACIVTGNQTPPADGCDCECESGQGRAWIRVTEVEFQGHSDYRASNSQLGKCPVGAWTLHVEVGVYRCVADQVDGNCDDKLTDAIAMHQDIASIINGIHCCPALENANWAPETAQPLGPSGGCIAAIYTFLVQINKLQKKVVTP